MSAVPPATTRRSEIEVHYDGQRLDEIVAHDAVVHLEQMSDQSYCLVIETARERAIFTICSKTQAHIRAFEFDRSQINRRSEAARRRENRKKYAKGSR